MTFYFPELDEPRLVNWDKEVSKQIHIELTVLSDKVEQVKIEFYDNIKGTIPRIPDKTRLLVNGDRYQVELKGFAFLRIGNILEKE